MRFLPVIALFAAAALAADAVAAGKYTGQWQGSTGAGGFTLTLTHADGGPWKADVSFTLADQSVPCTVTAVTVDGAKVHVVYTFDLMGAKLESTIDGERAGAKLTGKYKTRNAADGAPIDEGTWEASTS